MIMKGPEWKSTAIFLAWDDWGGFYDHVVPPTIDGLGYGLRVPGLVISPYAKAGYIDHQTLSFDAYLKFIEDDFLGGQRLDPATDGRPDPRPSVREAAPILGDLAADFDFTQPPRPPLLLAVHPPTTLTPTVPFHLIKPVASPEFVYGVVSEVTRMGEWSPETVKCAWLDGAAGPAVGARFKGTNRRGIATWSTKPTVVVADPGREFAFEVDTDVRWTYRFDAEGTGTSLTESFEMLRDLRW